VRLWGISTDVGNVLYCYLQRAPGRRRGYPFTRCRHSFEVKPRPYTESELDLQSRHAAETRVADALKVVEHHKAKLASIRTVDKAAEASAVQQLANAEAFVKVRENELAEIQARVDATAKAA
jgi:hypothetical protein